MAQSVTLSRFGAFCLVLAVTGGCLMAAPSEVVAQFATPTSPIPVPMPTPIPPPKIEVPPVPRMDAPLTTPQANLPRRGPFSDRVARCLAEGAAQGLGANDRAAYSLGCANRE
jgi:hypothetical protein